MSWDGRWLLLTLDRLNSDEVVMTQELLSTILGVRRASISEAAGRLLREERGGGCEGRCLIHGAMACGKRHYDMQGSCKLLATGRAADE